MLLEKPAQCETFNGDIHFEQSISILIHESEGISSYYLKDS